MRHLICVLIAVCACGKKPATKDLFGAKVTPPGVLAKIKPGMTLAEVKAIAPDATEDKAQGWLVGQPASDVKLYVGLIDDAVVDIFADVAGKDRGLELVTAAWGPPDAEPDRSDAGYKAWRSTQTGWRASVFCGGTGETKPFCWVKFHPHQPISAMFGKHVTPPGEMANAKPNMPLRELETATGMTNIKTSNLRYLDFDGVTEFIHLDADSNALFDLNYFVPEETRAAAIKAWGPGIASEGGILTWTDPSTGWMAELEKRRGKTDKDPLGLKFYGYEPFAKQMDTLVAASAMTLSDAMKTHPELNWTSTKNGEYTDHTVTVQLTEAAPVEERVEHRKILGVYPTKHGLQFVFTQFTDAQPIIDNFTTRWGAPKKSVDDKYAETSYRWPGHARMTVRDKDIGVFIGDR